MARKDRLIKSRTLYTIRKQHSVSRDGTIYENDYVTILPNEGNYDTDMDIFTESNFKYRLRTNDNSKRRHVRSEFVAGTSGDTWTLSGLSGHTVSEEGSIVLKPDYSSMREFAYYGSAVQMVRATVNDIVMRFPGGLSYYPDKTAPTVYISEGDRRYLVSNEFEIDCWSRVSDMPSGDSVNPMRILSLSYRNYVDASGREIAEPDIDYNGSTCLNSIVGRVGIAGHEFDIYMDGEGRKHLLTTGQTNGGGTDGNVIIRPKKTLIDGFWNTMDDFERVLLNRDAIPVYKAVLDTPYFTDDGWYYKPRAYQWPTVETGDKAFTPDLTTGRFQSYLASLIELAQFHDEHDSDNIVRMMTHEAIKNLDWSFTSWRDGEVSEDTGIDSGRISAALRVWGRAFDDIKRYAAGIKQSIKVSYDEKDNMPDYFLTDRNGNEGWMAVNTVPYVGAVSDAVRIDAGGASHDIIRSGMTAAFVNTVFQRNLYLNSRYIHSLKGTRRGIEALLGLFGYRPASGGSTDPGTFSISEYVCIVGSGLSYSEASRYRVLGEYAYDDTTDNLMHGYPVVQIFPPGKSLSSESYIMPWFDADEEYRNPLYFQEKGGWGKRRVREINLPSLTTATSITAGATLDIYGETWPYMMYATDTADMLSIPDARLRKNTVCYVEDISALLSDGGYVWKSGEEGNFSHYFVLKNTALSSHMGYIDNELYSCYGWRNVPVEEIEGAGNRVDSYEDGLRVLYMESMVSVEEGNNPHTGVGEYDGGEGYKNRFRNLFQNAFDEGLYDYLEKENREDYERMRKGYGFELTEKEDNRKCAFYADAQDEYRIEPVDGESVSEWNADIDGLTNPEPGGEKTTADGFIDEACAMAVMNVKKLVIRFNTGGNSEFRKYLQNVVFRYLEEMIPATAILSYAFDDEESAIRGRVTATPGRTRRARAAGVMVTGGDTGAVLHDDGIRKVSL